jgi:GNAT superfamily N-acetyltransferase
MEAARPATSDDIPRLAELCHAALEELSHNRGGAVFVAREARAEPLDRGLADELAAGHAVLAGTLDGVIVGYGVGHVEELRTGMTLGRITDLYVEPPARGVGVGEAMMEALLAWFEERRCAAVDAIALPGDRETKNFFEESGFTARMLVMHHRIDRAERPA